MNFHPFSRAAACFVILTANLRADTGTSLYLAAPLAVPSWSSATGSSLAAAGLSSSQSLGSFGLVIDAGSSLASNAPALAAFQRAAATWQAHFTNPITIHISSDLTSFGPGNSNIIGGTNAVMLVGGYDEIRNQMVSSSAGDPSKSIVAALPTAAQFSMQSLSGSSFSGGVELTKANAKALGYSSDLLDALVGTTTDAYINFNSDFTFDYDRSDGITAGTIDFESAALHEIGHALGFLSATDTADGVSGWDGNGLPYVNTANGTVSLASMDVTTLDLYRFAASNPPATAADFTSATRDITPGDPAVLGDTANNYAMSTGVALGDGRQAAHWKDNELTGNLIGAMDPTINYGQTFQLTDADLRAMELIGYDMTTDVPEPAAALLAGMACLLLLRGKR